MPVNLSLRRRGLDRLAKAQKMAPAARWVPSSTVVRDVGDGLPECADHRRNLMLLILATVLVLTAN